MIITIIVIMAPSIRSTPNTILAIARLKESRRSARYEASSSIEKILAGILD